MALVIVRSKAFISVIRTRQTTKRQRHGIRIIEWRLSKNIQVIVESFKQEDANVLGHKKT